MKEIGVILVAYILPVSFIVLAGVLACNGIGGWGWCVACGFILGGAMSINVD